MVSRAKLMWIIGFLILVLSIIAIGGVTRLTRSGLSIVEWRPVVGTLPPLSETQWQEEFARYQKTPEFQKVNFHFEIEDYKKIYFWEYVHRLLGRIIFLYVLIPGLILWRKKKVELRLVASLAVLVAAQGLIGWLMVRSGLQSNPHVSPLMLSLHFFCALFLLVYAYREISKARSPLPIVMTSFKKAMLYGLGVVFALQIFYGCLTSGLKAGLYYNSFPMMGASFLPKESFGLVPMWSNFVQNPVMVQWVHRWLGISAGIFLIAVSVLLLKERRGSFFRPVLHLVSITVIQVVLGVLNLLWAVPIPLAIAHQFMAALIVLGYFNIVFRIQERVSTF